MCAPGVNLAETGTTCTMDTKSLGQAGLRGWRNKVANVTAGPVAKRSSFSEDQIRAVVGGLFLALSIWYVFQAIKDFVSDDA